LDFLANLLPHLLNGVSLGLLFALIALGFMLIVGVMEVINLAHGSLFALGAYVAITLMGWKLSYALAFLLAPLVVGGVGMLLELCLRRTYGKDPLYGLLLTFGAALVLEELIRLVWGSSEKVLPVPEAFNGAVFVARCDWIVGKPDFLSTETVAYVMPKERSIDIDSEVDLAVAEALERFITLRDAVTPAEDRETASRSGPGLASSGRATRR